MEGFMQAKAIIVAISFVVSGSKPDITNKFRQRKGAGCWRGHFLAYV